MSEDPARLSDLLNYWYTVRRPDRFHYCTPGLEKYKKYWDIVYSCVKIVSDLKDLYDEDDECFVSWVDALEDAIEQFKPIEKQTIINEIKWKKAFRRKYANWIE